MRGRIIIASILLSLAVIISVASLLFTRQICNSIIENVNTTQQLLLDENIDSAATEATILINKWETQYKILSSYIPHNELERCEVSINSLLKYIVYRDSATALIICEDIKVLTEHLYMNEQPGIWNIF